MSLLCNIPDILTKLRLPDHLQGVISCLGGFGNVVPEGISQYFNLRLGCISIEGIGVTA